MFLCRLFLLHAALEQAERAAAHAAKLVAMGPHEDGRLPIFHRVRRDFLWEPVPTNA
jgi:hypothetical protein